jgi:hypothetical protein
MDASTYYLLPNLRHCGAAGEAHHPPHLQLRLIGSSLFFRLHSPGLGDAISKFSDGLLGTGSNVWLMDPRLDRMDSVGTL